MPIDGDIILKAALDTKNVEKSIEGLKGAIKKGFTTFLKYGLGVRSFFFLFRKLRKQLIDGFGNLAQVSQPFNAAMSSMQNALANLKSSFASAFAPIIQAVAPAITTFINLIANAVDAVGKLIAALTGQTTYIKYIATQQDYAQSVNDTANSATNASKATDKANKSAKKYQKTLAGFDDINILKGPDTDSDTGSSGSGGAGGSGGKLSPIAGVINTPLSQAFTDLSDKLKEAWEKADFTEIGTIVGTKLKEALDNIPWAGIKTTLWRIARSAATFLNGFFKTPGLFTSIGTTIAQAFNSALIFVYTFVSTLNWRRIGRAVVDAIVGFFRTFDWKLFGATLYQLLRGLFNFLQGAIDRIPWAEIPDAITKAISSFLEGFNWKDLLNRTIGIIKSALDGLIEMISGKEGENKDSPLVKALQSLKESVGKIDAKLFEDLGNAIGKLVKALVPVAEGFGAEFITFISDLLDLGVGLMRLLAKALDAIADALNKFDPEILHNVGAELGLVAAAFITMKSAWSIIQKVSGVLGTLGANGSAAATGIGDAGAAIGTAGETVGVAGGTFVSAATSFGGLLTTLGVSAGVTGVVHDTFNHVREVLEQVDTASSDTATGFAGVSQALLDTGLKNDTLSLKIGGITDRISILNKDLPDFETGFYDVAAAFEEAGGDVNTFKTNLQAMVDKGMFTQSQATVIQGYIDGIGKSADTASTDTAGLSDAFGLFSAPNFSAILKLALLKGAVDALGSSGKLSKEDTAKLQKTLDNYDASPTEKNMGKIQKAMENAGVSAGDLNMAYISAVRTLPNELKPEYAKLAGSLATHNKQTQSKMKAGGKNIVQGTIDGIEAKETDLSDKMDSVVKDDILGTFNDAADMNSPSKEMHSRGQYLLDGLKNGMSSRKESTKALVRTIITDVNKIILGFAGTFTSSGSNLMQNLYNGVNSRKTSLTRLISGISNSMENNFDTGSWSTIGHNAAVGLYNGFVALNGKLQQMVYRVASNMLAAAERALDIGSPSKKFAWIGEMTMLGLTGGIADNENQPINAVTDVTEGLEDATKQADLGITFDTKLSELLNTFDLILTDFSDIIIERFDNLIGSLAVLGTPAFANIPSIVQGKVVPTALSSTNTNNPELTNLRNAIDALNADRLTRQDITDIVTTAVRNFPVNLYIGDEQIATHANRGNAIISRRFG